jgi:F0F1-type ATP synthase assembly protein I
MRKEDPKKENIEEDAEDLQARFPDPETDERLRTSSAVDLPPVPQVTFTRPETQTARGYKPRPKRAGVAGGDSQASDTTDSGDDEAGQYRNMGIASTIGFSLVGSIIAGTVLGLLADRYLLHSTATPWGLIIGFLAGVLSGFISLIRVTNRLNK